MQSFHPLKKSNVSLVSFTPALQGEKFHAIIPRVILQSGNVGDRDVLSLSQQQR